ncbi:MAG: phosphatidylglycerol lysyltransferase domain-containing protein, partial [Proteobacteria bacterium]|nr:phosphatidylglycerol lysyltransferase domain-containing protein [Pseudomonadota bacterium]
ILIHDSGAAFLMYGIYGRSWVCLGGPIGADDTANADLLWDFRELCDEHGAWEVYYQVHPHSLPLLSETGLAFVKLGEEAIVDLQSFSLEGNSRKSLRHSHGRSVKLGLRFEIIDSTNVAPLLPELQKISDAWLKTKNSSEKGFSLGKFSAEYICQTAFALVLLDGRVIGFANILASNPKSELSIDLMRYLPDAPPGLMDYLFCQLMIWGRKEGFLSFNFGMAPLSGIENRPLAPLWNRFASFLFQHGEHFYNFQGIRSYKEKFHPKWEPRYLAYHPSASLPVVLTQVAALVAGGMKEVLRRS